ncbi:DUF6809 family protein [Paenibacillus sp. RC84]|uniref:DUF6809 family protein n=1 Tax=Paenibacillus sp. RC84 TaxID=3156252 RepID=UPI003510EA32
MSLVPVQEMLPYMNRQKLSLDVDRDGDKWFESGMEYMLRQIAIRELEKFDYDYLDPTEVFSAIEKVEIREDDLGRLINQKIKEKLESYTDAMKSLASIEMDECFIAGFIAGYSFLKKMDFSSSVLTKRTSIRK